MNHTMFGVVLVCTVVAIATGIISIGLSREPGRSDRSKRDCFWFGVLFILLGLWATIKVTIRFAEVSL